MGGVGLWDLRGAMIKNIALTLRLLFLGHRLLKRNRTQAAVIHIFNSLFFYKLDVSYAILNIRFQKYRYNFEL